MDLVPSPAAMVLPMRLTIARAKETDFGIVGIRITCAIWQVVSRTIKIDVALNVKDYRKGKDCMYISKVIGFMQLLCIFIVISGFKPGDVVWFPFLPLERQVVHVSARSAPQLDMVSYAMMGFGSRVRTRNSKTY